MAIDEDGKSLIVNPGNLVPQFVHKATGEKLTAATYAHLLEPLGVTPQGVGQALNKLYKNPGSFRLNSKLTDEEEAMIDTVSDELGISDQMEEDEGAEA